MKIRTGFVSNSSTSSFCIYGCCVDEDKAIDLLIAAGVLTEEDKKNKYDALEKVADDNNLEHHTPYDYGSSYFGFDFPSIPGNVKVEDWKAEKEAILKKLFGDNIDCCILSGAWRDG